MNRRTLFWAFAWLAVAAAAAQAFALRWTCDDAYISFRYALHFADGHGLVFNLDPAEPPVEGYTNFAWTMWLVLPLLLGLGDRGLEWWSIGSGVLCHAGTVLLLAAIAWRASGGRAVVPVAACGYAALHHAASLAPAGLETALFVLLVTAMLAKCCEIRCVRAAWLLGFLGVLAAMTRPDGALPVAAAGLFVAHDAWRRRAPALLVAYAVPFFAVFVPYLLWRHAFYGAWLPNTFYAKTGPGSYVPQGLRYAAGFFLCYWPLLLAMPAIGWFLLRRPDPLSAISAWLGRRPWLVLAAFVLPYAAFVVWVGGDFMFARFWLPIVPALLLAFDLACLRSRVFWCGPLLAAVVAAGFVLRVEPPGLDDYESEVSDNRRISMRDYAPGLPWTEAFRICGDFLRPLFAGLDVRLGIGGGHANLAFRSRVPVAIECAAGLTDAYIARIPVPPGGRRGHDRPFGLYVDYLHRRGVQFLADLNFGREDEWRHVLFTPIGLPMRLVRWDRALMAELRRREPSLQCVDFEQYLDAYLAALPQKSKAQVAADYAKFRPFWFDHTPDPARQQAFEAFLR